MTSVSVIGLGKLGACMAASMAHKGFHVIGVDINPYAVDAINAGVAPVLEPGLSEIMAENREHLKATADYTEAVLRSDISFIIVPTPSEAQGGFSLRYVAEAARSIGKVLREKIGYHLMVLTSTVLPGSTEFSIKPIIEQQSGKSCGLDFGLCYSPQFIALGSVIRDFLNPDFVLIGESDERAGSQLANFHKSLCGNDPPVVRMNFVNAELTKIAVNTFVTTKISFANMLAELCEQLPSADVDAVTSALGMDSRIGRRYLRGGLGYGGPCFPRDNRALNYLARQIGNDAVLAESTDRFNRQFIERMAEKVQQKVRAGNTVTILGLSYKPRSEVVEESHGLYLANKLAESEARVIVFDPIAMKSARRVLEKQVYYAKTLAEAVAEADVVVIANPDPAFTSLVADDFRKRPIVVIDCWRILRHSLKNGHGIEYIPSGVGNNADALVERLAGLWSQPGEMVR